MQLKSFRLISFETGRDSKSLSDFKLRLASQGILSHRQRISLVFNLLEECGQQCGFRKLAALFVVSPGFTLSETLTMLAGNTYF